MNNLSCAGGRWSQRRFMRAGRAAHTSGFFLERRHCLLVLAFGLAAFGCRREPHPGAKAGPAWFEDITRKCGLNFVHDVGPLGRFFMPETVGSGAALFDYDNDGRLDIYLLQNAGPKSKSTNRLFHQGADGKFTDVSAGSGLDVA